MADKKINILVSANTVGVTKGFNEASAAIAKGGSEIVQSSAKMSSAVVGTQKTLQQEYRSTFKAAQILAEQQGVNSAAFLDAAKQAGEFKNKLGDVSEITKAMSSDTPVLTAALGVGQGLAGAFAAAQGAMALFGTDSKALQETMLKVQASIALVSGLQALGGLSDSLVALRAVVATQVIPALVSLNAVIMANPFIALAAAIIAIGAAVYIWTNRTIDNTAALDANIKKNQEARTAYQKLIDFRLASITNIDEREKAQLIEKQRRERQELEKEFHLTAQYNDLKIAQEKMFQAQLKDLRDKQNKEKPKPKKDTEGTNLVAKGFGIPSEIVSKGIPAIKSMKSELLDLKLVASDVFYSAQGSANKFAIFMDGIAAQVGDTLKSLAQNGFQEFAEMAGAALAGEDVDFGKAALQMLGSIASALAAGLIAMGVPLLFSAITAGEGIKLIAAGGAMGVIAGALKAGTRPSKGGGGGGGGESFTPRNSAITYAPDGGKISVGGLVRGNNLVIASSNTERSNNRIR
jgi:hypothetical protein